MTNVVERLGEFQVQLEGHPVFENDYFCLLNTFPWSRDGFALHRANFFLRTGGTAKGIARLCALAADRDDLPTATFFSRILSEEYGNGELQKCHPLLMERAHNVFGEVVFQLDPPPGAMAGSSPLTLPATRNYRSRISELTNISYQHFLGVAMALETHAEKMLLHCRTAFRAHAGKFEVGQFKRDCEIYFNCHLETGVEERHAADALRCVSANCRTSEDLAKVQYGALQALDAQLLMWEALYKKAKEIDALTSGCN
jgi:hypothetical protein